MLATQMCRVLFIIFIGVRLSITAASFVYNIYRRSIRALYVYINITPHSLRDVMPSRPGILLMLSYTSPRKIFLAPHSFWSSRVRTRLLIFPTYILSIYTLLIFFRSKRSSARNLF